MVLAEKLRGPGGERGVGFMENFKGGEGRGAKILALRLSRCLEPIKVIKNNCLDQRLLTFDNWQPNRTKNSLVAHVLL